MEELFKIKAISAHIISELKKSYVTSVLIKCPWKGAYLFSPQFPRRRRIMVSLEYLPYY